MRPIFDMVMKSRVSDHASWPCVGTFSTPALSFGSGSSPAGIAISRAASTIERCEASCCERETAIFSASASDSGGSAAATGHAAISATPATSISAQPRRRRCESGAPLMARDDGRKCQHATSANAWNGPATQRNGAAGLERNARV